MAKSVTGPRAAPSRTIPLQLAPLLLPHRKQGRLSLRVERMHQLARLSRGRNNGDGSWSLASDELDDLEYLIPEGLNGAQTLSIRIIGLDQDGSTLAILDVPILPGTEQAGPRDAMGRDQEALLQRQRDELKSLRASLAEREAEIANLHRAAEQAEGELSRQNIASELASARESWKRDTEQQLAAAAAQSATLLEQSRSAWQAERNALLAESDSRAAERFAEGQERGRRETKEALAQAEGAWKAAEAARLVKAEAGWREKSAKVQAELIARCERAEAAAAKTTVKPARDEGEIRRLRDDLAAVRSTLADRDAALAEARFTSEQARGRWRQDSDAALSTAKAEWKAEEAARLAKSEALWRKQSAGALADETRKRERAEAALSEASAQFEAAKKPDRDDGEARRLREELASFRVALADRDAALVKLRLDSEAACQTLRLDGQAALLQAREDWKSTEAVLLADAETQWRRQSTSALAEVTARCERAEAGLLEARSRAHAEANAKSARDEAEIRNLQEDMDTLRDSLAGRDAALAQSRQMAEQAETRWRQELETALSNAKGAWKNEEASRFAAAEAQWRNRSANALAEATARYKEAETALAQIRVRAGSGRDRQDGDTVNRLRAEIALLQSSLAGRESEMPNAPAPTVTREMPNQRIALRENHDWDGADDRSAEPKSPRRLFRDIVVVSLLAASTIVLWPRLEPFIPAGWWPHLNAVSTGNGSASGASPAGAPAAAARSAVQQQMAIVVHGANVRADPEKAAAIVSTLQHGAEVAVLEQRNNWTLVRLATKDAKAQQGWVYSSFLKIAAGSEKNSRAATHIKAGP